MTYNPRIKNRRNNKLQVSGSILTGSVADFNVVTGSTVTGSDAYFTNITVGTLNVSQPVNTTSSFASNAALLDGFDSSDFVKVADLSTSAVTSLNGGNGITVSSATGGVTASINTGVVVTLGDTQNISGSKTFTTKLSGSSAEFAGPVTASTFVGALQGTASHATTAGDADTLDGISSEGFVQTASLSSVAVTSLTAGDGLSGSATNGSVTLAINTGSGITLVADAVAVDDSVVRTTGDQTLSGSKTFANNLSGTSAEFTSITGTLNGSITGNAATVTNGVYTTTISNHATTAVVAGSGLTGGGTTGSLTLDVGQGDGISVTANAVAVDSTVVRTSGSQSIAGVKTFSDTVVFTDVTINGTASIAQLNTISQSSLIVGDKYITLLSGATDHVSLDGSGFLWGSGSTGPTVNELGANAHVRYRSSEDKLEVFPGLLVSGSTKLTSTVSGTTAQFTVVTSSEASLGTANVNSLTATALSTNVTGVTSNFDLGAIGSKHIILVNASGSDVTGTLPLAANAPYRQFIFKKTDVTENALAVIPSGGETIDGDSKVEIVTQYETLTIVSDGVNKWFIV